MTAERGMHQDRVQPDLAQLLTLRPVGVDCFASTAAQTNRNHFIFGGQLLAQALFAAAQTVVDKEPHAMHASFEFPAAATGVLMYEIQRGRDGRSLSHRHVAARQASHAVLSADVSFSARDDGFEHQSTWASDPPDPDMLPDLSILAPRYETQVSGHGKGRLACYPQLEIRPIDVDEHLLLRPGSPSSRIWVRAIGPILDGTTGWTTVLAYLSDYLLVNAALIPHVLQLPDEPLFVASLNHAIWFHGVTDPAQWLLYETQSSWAGQGRALIHGRFFSRSGCLIASVAQEAMIRVRRSGH